MSALGIVGLIVLASALVVLLVSLLHPEGRRRPGGYLDGQEPHAPDEHDAPST